jgi:hypothetical protein
MMTMDEMLKNSLMLGLHAMVMGLLLLPLFWFVGGLTPRQEGPTPGIPSHLPFMSSPP